MRAFYSPDSARHDPQTFMMRGRVVPHEDRPGRAERLLAALATLDVAVEVPRDVSEQDLLRVHTERYLGFLASAWKDWQSLPDPGPEVLANVHPRDPYASYPTGLVGRAGWHLSDLACPVGEGTLTGALASASAAVAACEAVLSGEASAYALCRPPGHHAGAETAGGHCYLNNAAIAAALAAAQGARPAIIDIDVHHGNGTQAIFYTRADVRYVSVHTDPDGFYPWFVGHSHEVGDGEGVGANRNIVLPKGACDRDWLPALSTALEETPSTVADLLILCAGFDVHERDPLSGMAVSTQAIGEAGRLFQRDGRPTVIVQEGGYMSDALTANAAAFLSPFVA